MANEIKKIHVGTTDYELCDEYARKRLEGLSTVYSISCNYAYKSGDTFVDWDDESDIAYSAMTIKNSDFKSTADEITVSGVTTGTEAYLVLSSTKSVNKYYAKKMKNMQLGDTIYVVEAATVASDRWLSSFVESPLSAKFKALNEKIDLSEYAKKDIAGKAGTYTSSAASVEVTGEAGAETALGSGTYKKATVTGEAGGATITSSSAGAGEAANTGENGAVTISGSNFTFTGEEATLSLSGSYKPAGTISQISHASHTHTVSVNTDTVHPVIGVDANTGEAGAHTHSVSVSGEIVLADMPVNVGEGTATYTPAGSISKPDVSLTSTGKTVAVEGIKAVSSKFTGTQATISISGSVSGTGVGDHEAQNLTISGSQDIAAHSHNVTLGGKSTITYANGTVSSVSNTGAHTHAVDSHEHGDNVTVVTGVTAASLTGDKTFVKSVSVDGTLNYGFASSTSDVMTAPTVSDGVLSWILASAAIQDSHTVTAPTGTVGISGGVVSSTASVAGVPGAKTLTAASAGSHTHTVTLATATFNNFTSATLSEAGAVTVLGANFLAALPTLSHTVTDGSFSGSTTYTPAGSISNTYTDAGTISINHVTAAALANAPVFTGTGVELKVNGGSVSASMTGSAASAGAHNHSVGSSKSESTITYVTGIKSVSSEGAYTVTPTFNGTSSTITVSGTYEPEGTIGGSQVVAAHSHSYTKPTAHTHTVTVSGHTHSVTSEDATVNVSVAVSNHTHSMGHTHTVTVPNCNA